MCGTYIDDIDDLVIYSDNCDRACENRAVGT